ncbi:hypothetical protein LWP59_38135 [Amycolatopsis acidiphila]|uniref:HAD family hydrolase n=1 Tax=Amycolatopsis acidiphila TaxID=715473 RepID=A0A558ABQ8_9PSEU|nr:hypothetical protein [Amycolatopsis acidiphila]TVT21701.1 hypothetical protein FNH06_16220 [Amycolatopsis acidiphila]UIJ59760.1 hypothetical protein LWP59_38135 [Amycolatopsis acidiphila]
MRALLMDFGGVIQHSVLELLPAWSARFGLPDHITQRSGPCGALVDQLWKRMPRRELTEREYWAQRAAEIGGLLGYQRQARDLLVRVIGGPEQQ